jgi:hypothetical protein
LGSSNKQGSCTASFCQQLRLLLLLLLHPANSHTCCAAAAAVLQTRAQECGAPLKKEGAYNTDAYYEEMDQGFGDVGVDQVRLEA